MAGRGNIGAPNGRTVVYCVIPRDLAAKLHEPVRRHYAGDPTVEVIVERRGTERRAGRARRGDAHPAPSERRQIRNLEGRRLGDRRAALVQRGAPAPLPRRARGVAERIAFVERLEPPAAHAEDLDTGRLVTRFQSGETDVFTTIYMRYFDRVYAYLHVVTRDSHEAEDLTQDVFAKALDALPAYEIRGAPFRAWLFTIVRRHAIAEMRKHARLEVTDPADLPDDVTSAEDLEPGQSRVADWISDRDLVLFIERLPDPQRQVLVLRYMLGLTTSEIATVMERSEPNVRMLHSRALRFLNARLESLGRVPATNVRRPGMRRRIGQVPVLRERRFALMSPWSGSPLRARTPNG